MRETLYSDVNGVCALKTFYEFFCGGGMARSGLGEGWSCLLANDFDRKKLDSYEANWGSAKLRHDDIANLRVDDLEGHADLAWASFPCQDLSLAGNGAGLRGERSGTFWVLASLIADLRKQGRAPRTVVLENVCGLLTSHDGRDFEAIGSALSNCGYRFGAVVIDAVHFVPQSRPRLFIIAVDKNLSIPSRLLTRTADYLWHPKRLRDAHSMLDETTQTDWLWWTLPRLGARQSVLSDLIEECPTNVRWQTYLETQRLIQMMSDVNREKIGNAIRANGRMVGTIYKRTRRDADGKKVQRAEIRFDGIAGCLRTPSGGSSRQTILIVEGPKMRSRLLSAREAARLMGLPDTYILPASYNEAYHLAGDGLVVPVVSFLSTHLLDPLLDATRSEVHPIAA